MVGPHTMEIIAEEVMCFIELIDRCPSDRASTSFFARGMTQWGEKAEAWKAHSARNSGNGDGAVVEETAQVVGSMRRANVPNKQFCQAFREYRRIILR